MAPVRILVDGYSLLHSRLEIAAGRARHSEAARDELIRKLTRYHDATGTPISIFFDGKDRFSAAGGASRPEVEILFSRSGQTADQMIERATHRLLAYGEVLVVTDDRAEQDTVIALGGMTASCENFMRMVEAAMTDLRHDIKRHNRREQSRFTRPPGR
jgi:predicted RNA-binding protein with PIN domain